MAIDQFPHDAAGVTSPVFVFDNSPFPEYDDEFLMLLETGRRITQCYLTSCHVLLQSVQQHAQSYLQRVRTRYTRDSTSE
jgi:hypothetical protein